MNGKTIAACIFAIFSCTFSARAAAPADETSGTAATQKAVQNFNPSIDLDIRQMRFNAAPNFHYTYDDWLQYSPAVVLVGLKACGYKGRTSWGRMLVSDAFSGAVMAALVNATKYSVRRMRPDNTSRNSFPSGHTATAFMTATMLHKEYGWRSPWISIGGYTAATVVGVSRILNNRHWMSDVVAGGAIGLGSVHLGYFLSDLIFKEKYLYDGYEKPDIFAYDEHRKYYEAGLSFARRFVLGSKADKQAGLLPRRGSSSTVFFNIPIVPRTGIALSAGANELGFDSASSVESFNMYNALAGGFWQYPFPKLLEFELKAMIGYAWHREGNGLDLSGEAAAVLRAGEDFRIKAFAQYETFSFSARKAWLNSFLLGFSTSFCF